MRTLVTCMMIGAVLCSDPAALAAAETGPATVRAAEPAATAAKLDINKASREDLIALPGIGPAIAQDIVDLRGRKGSFTRLEELLEVRGIGEKNFNRIAPMLAVLPRGGAQPPGPGPAPKP